VHSFDPCMALRVSRVRSLRSEDRRGEGHVKRALIGQAMIGGIGNFLLGDAGVGLYVVRILESMYTPRR
jgi:hypothetical protein